MSTMAFRRSIGVLAACLIGIVVIPVGILAQGPNTIVDVAITGNQNVNVDTIQGAMTLKRGDEYTEQAGEKDKAAIMSLGYFSAVTLREDRTPEGVKLAFEVTENPRVTDIKVVGSDPVPASKIIELMKTKPGQVLNTTTLNQDTEAIQSYYNDLKYIAYVTWDWGVDPGTGVLTIPILVHTVESVEIRDNKKTKSYVFLREMKTKPGQIFNLDVLDQDMMKIYGLDILGEFRPPQVSSGTQMGQVKVAIPVQEKKTGSVSVGFGYSSRQRLVGTAQLAETNFRGRGQGLNLLWQQGTSDAVGGRASYELGFYEPWIDKQHTSLSVSGFNKILYRFSSGVFNSGTLANDQTYNERHKGGDITVGRPLSEKTRIFVGGRFENVQTNPDLLQSAYYPIVQTGNIGSGSIRLVHNTRDLEQDPAAGGYEALAVELGAVNGDKFNQVLVPGSNPPAYVYPAYAFKGPYRKLSVDLRRYFSKGGPKTKPDEKRVTLAMRLRLGVGGGSLPFFEQFFVGGADSLRGYSEDRFWGNQMMLASIELRKPIAQAIAGVLFVDYGDAWGGDPSYSIGQLEQSTPFQGNVGVGVGMRVSTPIGHLRLDYGVGREGGRTHFSMGQAF